MCLTLNCSRKPRILIQPAAAKLQPRLDDAQVSSSASKKKCSGKPTAASSDVPTAAGLSMGNIVHTGTASASMGFLGRNASSLASTLPYPRTKKCTKTGTKYIEPKPTGAAASPGKAAGQGKSQDSPETSPADYTEPKANGETTPESSLPEGSDTPIKEQKNSRPNSSTDKLSPQGPDNSSDDGSGSPSAAENPMPETSTDKIRPQGSDSGSDDGNGTPSTTGSPDEAAPAGVGSPAGCPPQETVTVTDQFTVTVTAGAPAAANTGAGSSGGDTKGPNANGGNNNDALPNTAAAKETTKPKTKKKCSKAPATGASTGALPTGTGGMYGNGTGEWSGPTLAPRSGKLIK